MGSAYNCKFESGIRYLSTTAMEKYCMIVKLSGGIFVRVMQTLHNQCGI